MHQQANWFVKSDVAYLGWTSSIRHYVYLLVESNKALYCEFMQIPFFKTLKKDCSSLKISNAFLLYFCNIFVLACRTDPHLPDVPIVYASDAFLKLTGAKLN